MSPPPPPALSECSRIDECQSWADKAEALASYAKQAKDESLRKMAERIQARAIRRCGELLKQIEPARGKHWESKRDGTVPTTRESVAAKAGLSERQRKTALRVANVPEEDFNTQVESDSPPTVTQLAEQGKKAKPLVDLQGIDSGELEAVRSELKALQQRYDEQRERSESESALPQHQKTRRWARFSGSGVVRRLAAVLLFLKRHTLA